MEEPKETKSLIPLSDENKEINNHLEDKLIYHFFPPLLIGVLGGIIIYTVCSIVFIKNNGDNNVIKNSVFKLNLEVNEQLILQVENLLMYRTQSIFDLLRKIENTTKFFSTFYKDEDIYNNFIKSYTININDINEQTEKNEYKAVWGKNEEPNNFDSLDKNIKKALYSFTALIPMLNSMYKSTNLNEEYIEDIFIIMNKNELYFDFPLTNDTMFKTGENRAFCFNELKTLEKHIDIPEKYDYHCQLWFSDSINLQRITNNSYYISSPYYIQKTSKILISTICLNSTKLNSTSDSDDYYLICINIKFQLLMNELELINHKLYGYFFVTRVFNQRAFYYPKSNTYVNNTQTYYFDNFNVEEFQLNDDYYLDELNEYINNKNNFIEIHNKDEVKNLWGIDNEELKGEFMKNNKKYYYYILPVFNRLSNTTINLLNIIYIYADQTTENIISNITNKIINPQTLVFLLIIFLIQLFVILILVNHLIRSIAFNIVLPMKNIKKVFEKFNNVEEGDDEDDDNLLIKNSLSSYNIDENREIDNFEGKNKKRKKTKISLRSKSSIFGAKKRKETKSTNSKIKHNSSINNKLNQKIDFDSLEENDDFLNNYEDIGSDSDDEENFINIKSKDIQNLFSKMINVKNSLDTVNSDEQNNIKKLPDLLFASEIFKEIKNENAKNISISNMANILLKLKKYDLAIMHLIDCENHIENDKGIEQKDNQNIFSFNKINNFFRRKNKQNKNNSPTNKKVVIKEEKLTKEQKEQKIVEKNKALIESRYPKLIYCYKKFFKNLKKLKKMNLSRERAKNKIINDYEFYISKNCHMINKFKEYIEKYIELCQIEGNYLNSNNRYIRALLEKIEFIIKYEINEENINNMEQLMDTLHDLLIKVKKLIKANKEITKPKNILKFLLKEEFTNELDEIPNSILLQRLTYYKGNLALKCGDYITAIKKYQKVISKSSDKITDIKISFKSIKKLIKIAELMRDKCKYNYKKTEAKLLKQYIADKAKELKKFKTIDRNFILLISTNTEDLDFFVNSLENVNYIIDNYIKGTDKYFIAFSSSDRSLSGGNKIIANLEEKKIHNHSAIVNYIQDIKQDYDLLSNYEENNEDDIKYILYNVKKFSNNNERKTYYIFFGNKEKLSRESINFLCGNEIEKILDEDKEKLILIMHENYAQIDNKSKDFNVLIPIDEKEIDINKLNKKVCSYIHFDEIQKIKDDVMMYGTINNLDSFFNFEKYEIKNND